MIFGFLIEIADVLNNETILFALYITLGIFLVRFLILKIFKLQTNPLLFIAPRGLITILIFLSFPISQQIEQIDKSLITQVIIISTLIMMLCLLGCKKTETQNINEKLNYSKYFLKAKKVDRILANPN